MNTQARCVMSKVPAVTLVFWIVKIAATTLGETGGDTVSMTMDLGYVAGCAIFLVPLVLLVAAQIRAARFNPFLYWAAIVAATLFGTTAADFFDRSLGIWYMAKGTLAVESVAAPDTEIYYWIAITFSQTLGTALGDWTSNVAGLGFGGGAMFFVALLAVLAVLYYTTRVSRVFLFWAAFILTRPLGATFGDLLDKPLNAGGMDISRPLISLAIAAFMAVCLLLLPQRAGRHPGAPEGALG